MGNINDRQRDECLTVYYRGDVTRRLRSRGFMSATLGCNNVLKTNRALRLFHTDLYTKKRKCNFGPVLYKENPDLKKIKKKSQNRLTVKQQGLGLWGESMTPPETNRIFKFYSCNRPFYRPTFFKLMIAVQHFDPCADAELALSVCTETVHDGGL